MFFYNTKNNYDAFVSEVTKEDKIVIDRATPSEKLKKKESISRYGSFYLRLGAIGKPLIEISLI